MTNTTKYFVFSCDAHVAEPPELFLEKLPEHLKKYAINSERKDGFAHTKIGDDTVLRIPVDFTKHKTGIEDGQDITRKGARDLNLRLADMDRDGVDTELVFPSLGLILPRLSDVEAQVESCKIYNDWAWEYTRPVAQRLVPAAMIPCIDLDAAYQECVRTKEMGYAAFCVWSGLGNYNDPAWDKIFAYAGENNIPLVFHVGVGSTTLYALKGPGGAMVNYTRQMNDAVDIIAALVGGGVLDRNPKAEVLFTEFGAGWLMGLAERLDEIYFGHAPYVSPKLGRLPSQIVRDQVRCSFQNDPGCMITRNFMSTDCFLFATDYPHSEGTFPFSRELIDKMFDVDPTITEDEKFQILGGNAARMFKNANLQPIIDAKREKARSAA